MKQTFTVMIKHKNSDMTATSDRVIKVTFAYRQCERQYGFYLTFDNNKQEFYPDKDWKIHIIF